MVKKKSFTSSKKTTYNFKIDGKEFHSVEELDAWAGNDPKKIRRVDQIKRMMNIDFNSIKDASSAKDLLEGKYTKKSTKKKIKKKDDLDYFVDTIKEKLKYGKMTKKEIEEMSFIHGNSKSQTRELLKRLILEPTIRTKKEGGVFGILGKQVYYLED